MRLRLPRLLRPAPGPRARLSVANLAWAAALGIAGGVTGAAARVAFEALQWWITGTGGSPANAAASLVPWRRLLVPVFGALLALAVNLLVKRWFPGQPHPVDYVEAVQEGGGDIPLAATTWRTVAAACSIATGAAIGREGAMIQFAAAAVARVGRFFRFDSFPLPRQVACGVAAGVATAYQAPLAGIFFAAEIVLLGAELPELALLAISSYTGWQASHLLLRSGTLFAAPEHLHLLRLPWWWALLLACALGVAGPGYQWLIGSMRAARRWPVALVWGGVAVGLLSVLRPTVWGNGDVALTHLVRSMPGAEPALAGAMLILLLRSIATPLCVGVGTVGGVFTPTLFTGATLGFLLAHAAPGTPALLFVLVGMGGLIAAVTHAPLMSSFMTVELTGRWEVLPLLLVCNFLASGVAERLSSRTLYGIATEEPQSSLPAPDDGRAL